ncbi:multidrug resistance transporter Bcr/CflA [Acetobacter aceti NRIC 0242]|uniref:Bcr/CflA family efflux transporter n=2 Tax=Acetobacter aceti TaxID=435 RepID=A0A6S6PP41_ACEAC|nr:multidrug effflux MFS transporter [Acetobacter aceti]GBO81243.1 multidrug resistance transporter Bcr/CflA [Acetobacter aceti NRIC 0242]TCS27507.1 DHA1 family bicyclomycin/chloramphenicol resistance-like MFS transporter [Acetobacter aceti NBRC 14818]BCI68395.1 Bcr/CflA family drug resistance efflux transporter [Acetobacter aceti]BCK75966.1 Bcr/CflA family drug resistance efflux transporter [Acetobacter aceti NBRC 14818]GAN58864.1 multidrug resistance efflux pump Bcr/CflA [Acetobacter aceti N
MAANAQPQQPSARHTYEARPTTPWWLPVLLGFLTAVGPISTDIYLPAFPSMVHSLHTSLSSVQMTLSIWFIGLAIGQLTVGPLSDRFGRRMPLIVGNVIFAISSAICAAAPDILTFSIARFIASIGASASLVIPTACVRDLVPDQREGARMMSKLVMVMGVVPILAPMLGGIVVTFVSWRVIFWASAAYGLLCVLLVLRMLPETLAPDLRLRLPPITLMTRYVMLLRHRAFLSHALIAGFSTFLSFSYLTAASPVFINGFHFTPFQFSMLFGLFAVFMIGASQVNGALVSRFDPHRLLSVAICMSLVGSLLLAAIALWLNTHPTPQHGLSLTVILVILAMLLTLSPTGVIYPNATMGALADQARVAGTASALAGTMQYVFGAIAGVLVGLLSALPFSGSDTPLPMAIGMVMGAIAMLFCLPMRPPVR